MKSICLCGGFGSRMLPSTKVINKHLLPVYSDQGAVPMIYYPITTLIKSGSTDILIITSDEAAGLMVETLGDGKKFGDDVTFTYKIQNMHDKTNPVGIASAMKLINGWVKDEPFAVILGDNFYEDSFGEEFEAFENKYNERLVDNKTVSFAHIFLKKVEDPERFGVATIDSNGKVIQIVEKPKNPESNLAVTGLYLYTPHVFNIIKDLKPSQRGELEVSDINQWYVEKNKWHGNNDKMMSSVMAGYWSDMGIPSSMARTQEWINTNNYRIPLK